MSRGVVRGSGGPGTGGLFEIARTEALSCGRDAGSAGGSSAIMSGAGGDLDKAKPVAVICRTGNRSELATMMLQARGYDAHNVEGGMEAWDAAGLPFEAADGSPGRVA